MKTMKVKPLDAAVTAPGFGLLPGIAARVIKRSHRLAVPLGFQ